MTIYPETGFLVVEETALHGSMVTLTATLDGREEPVTRELTIFPTEQNPLLGRWREETDSGGVGELLMQVGGKYAASW